MAGINDLLRALTPVKPGDDVAEAAASGRINAIQELLRALVRGDNIIQGLNVRKQSQDGWVILSANPTGRGGGKAGILPFQVNNVSSGEISVAPGLFVTTVATLYGTALDATPAPTYTVQANPFSLFLRITLDYDNLTFRYAVSEAEIVTDDDDDVTPDITGAEVPELKMFWDDPATKVAGHFYIKVADLDSSIPVGGSEVVCSVTAQWLFSNYRAFVLVGDDVTVLAP
jgi:hypothetical protein